MKKLLAFTTAAFLMTAPAAFAEDAAAPAPDAAPAVAAPESTPEDGRPGGGRPDGGKLFERADANGDGTVTKEEFMAESTKRFEEMDIDADGKVTQAEADAHAAEMRAKWRARKDEMRKERAIRSPENGTPAAE